MAELRTVTVTCRQCGPVELCSSDVQVTAARAGNGLFAFSCSTCGRDVWQAADASTLLMLKSVGARDVVGVAPLELMERHAGLAIDFDELLDAHEAMRDHCCPQDELTA